MHLLQARFPDLGAVSDDTVREWAHANGVLARPWRGLLHDVAPGTAESAFIIELAEQGQVSSVIARLFAVSTHVLHVRLVRLPFSRLVVTTPLTLRACSLLAGSVHRV